MAVEATMTKEQKNEIIEAFMSGKTRKELAVEFNLPYNKIVRATKGMKNGVKMHEGRFEAEKIWVDKDLNIVSVPEGADTAGLVQCTKKEWAARVVSELGYDRKKIAEILGISYGGAYAYTKGLDIPSARQQVMVTLENGTQVPRKQYIKERVAAGVDKSDLAEELGVPYATIWQALYVKKTTNDLFNEALDTARNLVRDCVAFEEDVAKTLTYLDEIAEFERHA